MNCRPQRRIRTGNQIGTREKGEVGLDDEIHEAVEARRAVVRRQDATLGAVVDHEDAGEKTWAQ